MKPIIQKLPLNESTSFIAKTFRTPHFEVGWHQHIEYELILFTEGSGLSFIGNHVGEFETDDIYFLGSNLPHTFQKRNTDLITSALVVQFTSDFWGDNFLNLPELKDVKSLLAISEYGLKLKGKSRQHIKILIKKLEGSVGFERILLLGNCLQIMANFGEYITVSTQEIKQFQSKDKEIIDKVFQFTITNFKELINLEQVASIACMSIPAFCNYFKKSTKKTYVDFLNEVRIGYACTLLIETKKYVSDICFESGYNTMANFHKQFMKVKGTAPLQYRKSFAARSIQPAEVNVLLGLEPPMLQ